MRPAWWRRAPSPTADGFSERDFYLAEFRGRTLAFALPSAEPEEVPLLESVLSELEANRTRVLVLSADRSLLEKIAGDRVLDARDPRWIGRLWRAIRNDVRVGIAVGPDEVLASACRRVVLRLRLAKLVWIDPAGPLRDARGERISLLDGAGIAAALGGDVPPDRRALLEEIRTMLGAGLPAVNLCSLGGLDADLFTFEGSGTFFARERYLDVRRLSLDEFDAADRLIGRGVEEGYLVERSPEQLEEILANAFGVFVEGRYLAGRRRAAAAPGSSCGEIGSLYTLTRFVGEGVGGHLVSFALECAAEHGLRLRVRVHHVGARPGLLRAPGLPRRRGRRHPGREVAGLSARPAGPGPLPASRSASGRGHPARRVTSGPARPQSGMQRRRRPAPAGREPAHRELPVAVASSSERPGRGLRFFPGVRGVRVHAAKWTVSRVLFRRAVAPSPARIIHLGDALPRRSSTLTRALALLRRAALRAGHPRTAPLFELAPGRACLAAGRPAVARGLLPHDFTLACAGRP